jgi:hypothetical protein
MFCCVKRLAIFKVVYLQIQGLMSLDQHLKMKAQRSFETSRSTSTLTFFTRWGGGDKSAVSPGKKPVNCV